MTQKELDAQIAQDVVEEVVQEQAERPPSFKGPIVDTRVRLSNDKKWIIHETVITDIKPVLYFEKVLASASPSGVPQ